MQITLMQFAWGLSQVKIKDSKRRKKSDTIVDLLLAIPMISLVSSFDPTQDKKKYAN